MFIDENPDWHLILLRTARSSDVRTALGVSAIGLQRCHPGAPKGLRNPQA